MILELVRKSDILSRVHRSGNDILRAFPKFGYCVLQLAVVVLMVVAVAFGERRWRKLGDCSIQHMFAGHHGGQLLGRWQQGEIWVG